MSAPVSKNELRQLGPWIEGDDIAEVYDTWCESLETLDTDGALTLLADFAAGGPVLELAVGTGRLSLPLVGRGLEVHGVDALPEMLAKLREKPGGDRIHVTVGDLVDVPVDGCFRLVFLAFNTFFGLPSSEDQQRCFHAVADHLTEDGVFVLEVSLPDLRRFDDGERSVQRIEFEDLTLIDIATHDAEKRRIDHQHVVMRPTGTRAFPFSVCYALPQQLDEMAEAAGLRLRQRSTGWRGGDYIGGTLPFISVYERMT